MDKLWAPWRQKYTTLKKPKKCIFCIPGNDKASDRKNYILRRNRYSFSLLNKYPYNNGHVMIAPYRHVKSPELLRQEELLDLVNLVNYTKKRIDKSLNPDGYNIGLNVGKVSGAGFSGHVHIHMVPRWEGDANFMSVISDGKVLSVSLGAMYKILHG